MTSREKFNLGLSSYPPRKGELKKKMALSLPASVDRLLEVESGETGLCKGVLCLEYLQEYFQWLREKHKDHPFIKNFSG